MELAIETFRDEMMRLARICLVDEVDAQCQLAYYLKANEMIADQLSVLFGECLKQVRAEEPVAA